MNRILQWMAGALWAIQPEVLALLVHKAADLVADHKETMEVTETDSEKHQIKMEAAAQAVANGGVAVIPITGIISQRETMFALLFGGSTTEGIARALRQAVADPSVGSIVLDIDSPGGNVMGIPELAAEILAARGIKPIIAVANGMAASAAFWIAASASEVVVTPSGMVGSIGVFTVHEDLTALAESMGVKITLMAAGKFKTEGHPFEPLTDEARANIQGQLDTVHEMFIRAVAKGRGVTPNAVRNGFGEGRVVLAAEAVKLGMADRVDTLAGTLARLVGGRRGRRAAAALGTSGVMVVDDGLSETASGTIAIDDVYIEFKRAAAEVHAGFDKVTAEGQAELDDIMADLESGVQGEDSLDLELALAAGRQRQRDRLLQID